MDPNACLARIIDAATCDDTADLEAAAADLIGWLNSGGFPPSDPRTANGGKYRVYEFTRKYSGPTPHACLVGEFDLPEGQELVEVRIDHNDMRTFIITKEATK